MEFNFRFRKRVIPILIGRLYDRQILMYYIYMYTYAAYPSSYNRILCNEIKH